MLFRSELIGTNLFSCIADEMTKLFYHTLFAEVSRERRDIRLPYRCDGPDIRREMTIAVLPDSHDRLTIVSIVNEVSEIGRPDFTCDAKSPQVRCSCCNSVLIDGTWHDSREAQLSGGALELNEEGQAPVCYGICPVCAGKIRPV